MNAGRAGVFLNEGAGSAQTERVRRAVALARDALGADLHVTATRDPAELEAWLEERLGSYETAVIVGGDGSFGTAYNVAARLGGTTVLGYIPAGFGNATAHLLRLPREPEALVALLARRSTRPIDLVAVDGRLALFAGAGWDALVAGRYADAGAQRLRGWAVAVGRSMPDLLRRATVEVHADGWSVYRGPMTLMVVSTTPYYGRGLKVNPGARPDVGRLSLRIYPGPALHLAAEAVRWLAGAKPTPARIDAAEVVLRTLDGRDVPVQADGDLIGASASWSFAIRPRAVSLIGRWD